MTPQFLLASQSPRRQELLRQLHYHFELRPAGIPEQAQPGETSAHYARRLALEKARAAQALATTPLPVLGADTDVVLDGRILGKPCDRADALAMLAALSNREHEVYSAVAVVQGGREEVALSVTAVSFGEIAPEAAARYWDSGEPADKAGAYGIQGIGAQFVKAIRGSYSGVVGLPLYETVQLLKKFNITPGI
ncbi:MAG: Maf family protein [Stenotrophobium sp.]